MPAPDSAVLDYHDGTRHFFHRFARSLGYLDWASQPKPFRRFTGSPARSLYPVPSIAEPPFPPVDYSALFRQRTDSSPLSAAMVGDLLRHSLGLSAWKTALAARWSLRVNPSSGNLHPTEAYVVGVLDREDAAAVVAHYAPEEHALDVRCSFDRARWEHVAGGHSVLLVGLTSIHWREAWKYGERAFRYCQHDLGHAMAAVSLAARLHGWKATLLSAWEPAAIATLLGLDRADDFFEAEPEEVGPLLALVPDGCAVPEALERAPAALVESVAAGAWGGRASQLSEDHVDWSFIDAVADATRLGCERIDPVRLPPLDKTVRADSGIDARRLFLQRRSAVAFDGRTSIPLAQFVTMMKRLLPAACAPWDALWWTPCIHLLLFVHRVEGLPPGLYLLGRDADGLARLLSAIRVEFARQPPLGDLPLVTLVQGDCRAIARRLSCDQDIAADGAFSLGMLADFSSSLERHGAAFYRRLFWEAGVVGQMLYLEAEAIGIRGTGIGCFYDPAVHELIGLGGHEFQSLYHFTVGGPVEDRRLSTTPGYGWEGPGAA